MTTLTQPIKWHGGKHYLAKRIIAEMPPRCKNPNAPVADDPGWLHYVEPFFGGGSVLLEMDPEGISEAVNDKNSDLIAFWSVLAHPVYFRQFQRVVEALPFSAELWERMAEPDLGMFEPGEYGAPGLARAVAFFVRARQSRQGLMKDFATLSRNRTRRGMNEQASSWLTAIEGLPDVHARLRRVAILNDDAVTVIKQQDGPRTLFYCDPPYVHETRVTKSDYAHEMTLHDHNVLLHTLADIKGRFILSGYPHPLYERPELEWGWRRIDIEIDNKASGKREKEKKTECLWMNY